MKTGRQIDRKTRRQEDRKTVRQEDRLTERQKDRKTTDNSNTAIVVKEDSICARRLDTDRLRD